MPCLHVLAHKRGLEWLPSLTFMDHKVVGVHTKAIGRQGLHTFVALNIIFSILQVVLTLLSLPSKCRSLRVVKPNV